MALRFADSFDGYQAADITKYWTSEYATNGPVSGGRYLNCYDFASAPSHADKTLDQQATWIIGFAYKFGTLPASRGIMCSLFESSGAHTQFGIGLDAGGHLFVQTGGTGVLATGTDILSADAWYYIELKVTINNTTGSYAVQLNGVAAAGLSGSGVNTRHASSSVNSADQIRLNGGATATHCYFDDLYVCDGTGATNNDFLGDVRVECLFPDGAGASTQWTASAGSNYQCVDESATDFPNEDTDYVYSGTATNKDTYTMSDLAYTSGTVYGLLASACAKKEDAGVVRTLHTVVRSNTNEASGTTQALSASGYFYLTDVFETDPQGGGAWTITRVNAMQSGFELDA